MEDRPIQVSRDAETATIQGKKRAFHGIFHEPAMQDQKGLHSFSKNELARQDGSLDGCMFFIKTGVCFS